MPTINDLRQQAATIKNATQVGENTATRVGTTFETIADLLEGANVGQGIPSVDLAQLNSLRTPADQTTTNPTVYNVTTLHNLSSTTIKVGTLFIFSDGGRAVVTQILLSNYQVDGGGNISSPNASQITMYYRMYNIVQETWSAWTLYAGGGGGGTIDPYPVSGSDNAVASNGVFEGLQKAAPEVNINDIDDIDDFVDMQTGVASTYTIKAYHNLSSTWLRVGVLMVFANQAQNTLTQICISNCMVDGGGNLIPNYTTNVMNVFYRFKQFSGNPPEGMTIGVWTTWAKFGDSGYQPDNEDIDLNANDQLQFANKAYDASAFSGLGRVYLRKNIVDVSGTDKNVLTQSMVNTANTIYHIQYDYDLNGHTITLPAGCVLEFDGGSVKNGTIVGTNTRIIANEATIFKDIIISSSGTWDVETLFSRWFDSSDETAYSTIDNLLNMNNEDISTNIYIRGDYDYVPTHAYDTQAVKSNTTFYVEGTITNVGPQGVKNLFDFGANAKNISFYGGTYIGNLKDTDDSTTPDIERGHCFMFREASNITLEGCIIQNFTGDGIAMSAAVAPANVNQNIIIRNCVIDKASRNGITILAGKNIIVENCIIKNITRKAPKAAIDIEPNNNTNPCNNISIRNCRIDNCVIGIGLANTQNSDFSEVSISNCHVNVSDTPLSITKVKNALIENSIFTSTNTSALGSMYITYCESIRVINNTFALAKGITGSVGTYYSGNKFSLANGGFSNAEGVFENNIIEVAGVLFGTGALIQTGHRQNFVFNNNRVKCKNMVFLNTQYMVMKNNNISMYDASSVEAYFINASMYDVNSKAIIQGNTFDIDASTRHFQFWPACNLDISNNIIKVASSNPVIFTQGTASIPAKNNSAQGNVFILPERFSSTIYSGLNTLTSSANKEGNVVHFPSIKKYATFDGSKWVDENGFTAALSVGKTTERPTNLFGSDNGFQFFDSDLGKPIFNKVTIGASAIVKTNIAKNEVDGEFLGVTAVNTLTQGENYKYETTYHLSGWFKAAFRKTNNTAYDDADEILICESNAQNDHIFLKAPDPSVYPYVYYCNRGSTVVTAYIKNVSMEWTDSTGVPAANSLKVLKISQTDYDALATKDANTLYVIIPS